MTQSVASDSQKELARALGIELSDQTEAVAAAFLHDAVARAILDEPRQPSTSNQRVFAGSLNLDVGADSRRVASARIREARDSRNRDALQALQLAPGDRVVRIQTFEIDRVTHFDEREFIVSSIGPNHRVFFKGGQGQGAWPTQLRRAE